MRRTLLCLVAVLTCSPTPDAGDRFARDVAPVLERGCLSTACHGVAPGERESDHYLDERALLIDVNERGAIRDLSDARDQALRFVNTVERRSFSTLLRKPLAEVWGGLPHTGGTVFSSPEDKSYRVLLGWIETERQGDEGQTLSSLPDTEQFFANEVLPGLRDAGCLIDFCHGRTAIANTALAPPADPASGEFSVADIEANYKVLRKFLHLSGEPLLGRLVRKPLPPERGGITHRGGNDVFFTGRTEDDPRDSRQVQALVEWTRREQAALAGGPFGVVTGIVFVRGPAAPSPIAELEGPFVPGSDIHMLSPPRADGRVRVITGSAHPTGPADVRDPAVSHDGRRVAFAMRTRSDDCFHLYEVDIETGEPRARTGGRCELPGGGRLADRWPVYGPDGRLYFSSTRAGILREHVNGLDADLWSVGESLDDVARVTFTPSPELGPAFLSSGKTRGELVFTMLRTLGERYEGVLFRFPLCHNGQFHGEPEVHIHHGATSGADAVYHPSQLPDGREVVVLLDRDAVAEAGGLALVERSFGPDLQGVRAEPSVPGFRHAVIHLDPTEPVTGVMTGGMYRDPSAMPDGSVIVAYSSEPVDPTDREAAVGLDFAISQIVLEDRRDGSVAAERRVLVDAKGQWDVQPVPVYSRALEEEEHPYAWDPQAPTGVLSYRHFETLEAVFGNPRPAGGLRFPEAIEYVRLIEHVAVRPDELPPVDEDRIRDGDQRATWISNGVHDRTRILAELPVAADTSFVYEVPSGVPFRIQALDAEHMAVGAQQNRWIFVNGGETFPGGISKDLFDQTCGPCHGTISGRPEDGAVVPDAITRASITLATHENLDPRRRLPPLIVDGSTRIEIDYRRDVQPILDRSCAVAGCHAGPRPAAGLALSDEETGYYSVSYESLLARGDGSGSGHEYVDERNSAARSSVLVERLVGRELDAPRPLEGSCPPPGSGAPPLTSDELLTIVRWIELGAVFRGAAEEP